MPIPKCKTVECSTMRAAGATYRGLCLKCYSAAKKMVEAGTASWEDLERLGLVLPMASDPFTAAFDAAKGKVQ